MPKHPKVFLEFTIGSKSVGRVIIELYNDITPLTAENFRGLCTGEYARSQGQENTLASTSEGSKKSKLHYLGSKIHRIVDGFVIQGGDITKGDGTGGDCIFPGVKTFKDENFERRHAHAGILSMANCGPGTNSSQFFITLQECQHLDGKHVVFGQVTGGMDVIRQIAKVPTDMTDRPRIPVHILNCGEINDQADDSALDSEEEAEGNAFAKYQREMRRKREAKMSQKAAAQPKKMLSQAQEEEEEKSSDQASLIREQMIEKLKNPMTGLSAYERRKAELQLKINQSIKMNNTAVLDEQQRLTDPLYERKKAKEEYFKEQRLTERDLENKGIDKEKKYLFETAIQAEKMQGSKKRKRNKESKETYGWEVFNTDSLYRAYEKRVRKVPKLATESGESLTKEERISLMAKEVEDRIAKRGDFSRRRTFNSDKDVTSINERNRHFNDKLERNYSKYANEIKSNLERGTAL